MKMVRTVRPPAGRVCFWAHEVCLVQLRHSLSVFKTLLMYNCTMCLVVIHCVPGHVEGTPQCLSASGETGLVSGHGATTSGRAHHHCDLGLARIELPESTQLNLAWASWPRDCTCSPSLSSESNEHGTLSSPCPFFVSLIVFLLSVREEGVTLGLLRDPNRANNWWTVFITILLYTPII